MTKGSQETYNLQSYSTYNVYKRGERLLKYVFFSRFVYDRFLYTKPYSTPVQA